MQKMNGFGEYKKFVNKNKKKSEVDNFKKQIINHAIQLQLNGNVTEATKYYQKIINQGCEDPRVFANYGFILRNLGKLQEAVLSTRKAIELNPNYVLAHSNLGLLFRDLGKLKDPIHEFFFCK